jgi:uncharacterized membrane protein YsdA (DUF1294 family)/cold shock CspA family protein
MRYVGRLVDWDDGKGFGFVEPNGGGERAFVHVTAIAWQGRRPANGDLVSYEVQRDARGRANAANVCFAGAGAGPARARARRGRAAAASRLPRKSLALLCFAALGVAWWLGRIPAPLAGLYAGMSVLALVLYARDKAAARGGQWRTPESTLHAVAMFGGWPGALLAQDLFRHKATKAEFQFVFWTTVVINCAVLGWLLHADAMR